MLKIRKISSENNFIIFFQIRLMNKILQVLCTPFQVQKGCTCQLAGMACSIYVCVYIYFPFVWENKDKERLEFRKSDVARYIMLCYQSSPSWALSNIKFKAKKTPFLEIQAKNNIFLHADSGILPKKFISLTKLFLNCRKICKKRRENFLAKQKKLIIQSIFELSRKNKIL